MYEGEQPQRPDAVSKCVCGCSMWQHMPNLSHNVSATHSTSKWNMAKRRELSACAKSGCVKFHWDKRS